MSHQKAYAAIAAERTRQQIVLGYDVEHDSQHHPGQLLQAGRAYLTANPHYWPFDPTAFKPRTHVRNLIRGGALFMAAADIARPGSGPHFQAERLAESTVAALAAEITAVQMLGQPHPEDVAHTHRVKRSTEVHPGPEADCSRCNKPTHTPQDGDEAYLKVKVYRADGSNSLIEFVSMQGWYSIRVPNSELVRRETLWTPKVGDRVVSDFYGPNNLRYGAIEVLPAPGIAAVRWEDDPQLVGRVVVNILRKAKS